MSKQMNDWMEELKGYAKRSFAEKKAKEILGDMNIRWFIYPQANGRFAPVAIWHDGIDVGYLVFHNIGVMN